jgi:hypothetical protein
MSMRWRIGLAAMVAAVVLVGVVPHTVVSAAEKPVVQVVQLVETPVSVPVTCVDATCGKGSPVPAAPVPVVALVAIVGGLLAAAAARVLIRRRRGLALALPAGTRDALFHPPQFS